MKRVNLTKCERLGVLLCVIGLVSLFIELITGARLITGLSVDTLGLTLLVLQLAIDGVTGQISAWLD